MGLPLPPISFPADGRSSSMACHALWRTSTHMVNGWLFPQNHGEDPWIWLGYLLYLLGNHEGFRYWGWVKFRNYLIFWVRPRSIPGNDLGDGYRPPWLHILAGHCEEGEQSSHFGLDLGVMARGGGTTNHTGSGYKNYDIFTVASLEMFTIYFRKGSLSQNVVSSGWWLVHYYNLARMDLTTRHGCFFCLVHKFAMISERNRPFHGGANILFRKSPRLLISCINRHA